MTDVTDLSRYREGRQAGNRGARESHEPRLDVRRFLVPGPVDHYVEWDGTNGIIDWEMGNNGPDPTNPPYYPNGVGNCGEIGVGHGNAAKANNITIATLLGHPKYANGLATYFAYGVSQGEQGQPPAPAECPDQGVDNASWLAFLYKMGIIYGYGEVPVDQMDNYAPQAHGLLIGQNLSDSAEPDFEAHPPIPWGSHGEVPDNQEGHDTWYILGHADGTGELITWGGLQPFTVTYRKEFITDAWIIFDEDDPNVDHAALQAALTEVHGVDSPPATEVEEEAPVELVEVDVVVPHVDGPPAPSMDPFVPARYSDLR